MIAQDPIHSTYDAVIVGGRVAGASTALLLARGGQRVLVLEKGAAGSDTTSTHALMRAGVMQLHRWGVLDRLVAAGTPPIRRTTFHYGDESVEIEIKARDGVDILLAPRRTVIDVALVDAARDAGARIIHGATVESLVRSGGRVAGVVFRDSGGATHRVATRMVIGADGARSMVAHAVDAPLVLEARHRSAVIYRYYGGLELNGTQWYYGRDVAAGAIPTNDGLANVFVAMRPGRYESHRGGSLEQLFADVMMATNARLAADVARATPASKLHPFPGRRGFIRRACGPGWALVGDAGSFKDPLTAHGMTDVLRDAEMLARAVLEGSDAALADYESARDSFAVEFLDLSDEIGSFDWDFERVKTLHQRLSRLMNREYELVLDFSREPAPAT